jgi:hypothetical protein
MNRAAGGRRRMILRSRRTRGPPWSRRHDPRFTSHTNPSAAPSSLAASLRVSQRCRPCFLVGSEIFGTKFSVPFANLIGLPKPCCIEASCILDLSICDVYRALSPKHPHNIFGCGHAHPGHCLLGKCRAVRRDQHIFKAQKRVI